MRLLTAAEQRELDALAASDGHLPTRVLMETAGAAVARIALESRPRRAAVFCGPGNNGGDGYVAARFLREEVETIVIASAPLERLKGDARAAALSWSASGGAIVPADAFAERLGQGDVVIDAIFGSGLSRPPMALEARAIELMNDARARGARVIAIDVPSGVDSDSGAVFPRHLARADETVTFHAPKRGLYLHPGAESAGRLRVQPIGIPRALEERLAGPVCELLDDDLARALLSPRAATAHKHDFGHVLAVAGSPGKAGAAALLVEAALRAGAGLVTLAARAEVLAAALPLCPEAMGVALPERGSPALSLADLGPLREALKGKTALAIGPGIARGPETPELIGELLASLPPSCAAVLDADALNALAERRERIAEWCGRAAVRPLLTPHAAEFCRLTGEEIERVEADRIGSATRAAQRFSACIVLKGSRTVIADPEGGSAICPTGNPGMATAGSGDVLTGIAAALLARRGGAGGTVERGRLAVYLHGLAGDLAAEVTGQSGLIASDIIRIGLRKAFLRLGR